MVLDSNEPQIDEKRPLVGEVAEKKPLFSPITRLALVFLVIVSFATAVFSTGWEILELAKGQLTSGTGHLAKVQADKEAGPLPPVHPIYFFPKSITGYTMFGKQKVRGEEAYAAETIFKPEDEQYSLVEPLNVYVKVVYYGSDDAAQKDIDRIMSRRKVTERINIELEDVGVSAGYTEDRSSLIIAWVKNGYAVEVDASYTRTIPAEETDALEKNALTVAKEIWAMTASEQQQ